MIADNRITDCGDIGALAQLERLFMWKNRIASLPDKFGVLVRQTLVRASSTGARVREIFSQGPVLLVGCSLEGLLEDLEALAVVPVTHKHLALCGVAGPGWENQVEKLSKSYGVDVICCSAHTIQAELPEFLQHLAEDAESSRAARAVSLGLVC